MASPINGLNLRAIAILFAAIVVSNPRVNGAGDILTRVDHLIYATPDLKMGMDAIEKLFGARATAGGQHLGEGTRGALISLGPATYLEIVGPDPEQPNPVKPRRFGIDDLAMPRLAAWAAKGQDLDRLHDEARSRGVTLGDVVGVSRRRPDGLQLFWRNTNPRTIIADGLVPYFIEWSASPHPSRTSPAGVRLTGLRAEHPDSERVNKIFAQLGIDLLVQRGPRPSLIATFTSPKGRVELRN